MMSKNTIEVFDLFGKLNKSNIRYALLRNVNNELPFNFSSNKDIDIIVNPNDKEKIIKFFKDNNWKRKAHPLEKAQKIKYLYALDEFLFYTKGQINLDVSFQLSCKSTNGNEWMPLDQFINNNVWKNIKRNNDFGWNELSYEYETIHLITRCVFDKKSFNLNYIKRMNYLSNKIDFDKIYTELSLIFFKFTPILIKMILNKEYNKIINTYLSFGDY